jgi:hypothetical protein
MADKVSVELTEKLLIEQASQWLSRMIPTFVNALNARADAADPLSCIYEGKLAGKLPVRCMSKRSRVTRRRTSPKPADCFWRNCAAQPGSCRRRRGTPLTGTSFIALATI